MGTGKPFIPGKAAEIAHYEATDALITEDYIFKSIDDGFLFRNTWKYDLADEGVGYMLIKAGTKYPHVAFNITGDGDTTIELFHTPTVTLDGDEEPPGNFNFNSLNTSLTTWFPEPTIGVDGTPVDVTWILGGSGVGIPASSRAAASISEYATVLIPSVEYLVKITNDADRDTQTVFEVVYQERTDG